MENKFVSLLYPTETSQFYHQDRNNLPNITEEVCDELGLNEIFGLKSCSLTEFFTADEDVSAYRQGTMADLLSNPELLETLSSIQPILDDIREQNEIERSYLKRQLNMMKALMFSMAGIFLILMI